MKKLFFSFVVIAAIFIAAVYLLIPSKITIASAAIVKTTDIGAERFVIDETQWGLWWNYGSSDSETTQKTGSTVFTTNRYRFQQTSKFYKSVDISISKADQTIASKLVIIGLATDSTGIEWKCQLEPGNNPFARIVQYMNARRIKQTMDSVLANLKRFLVNPENVYGIKIEKNFLKDTLYVSTKQQLPAVPSNKEIYGLIETVKNYIVQHGTQPTGSPIYNVTQMDKDRYQLMVAVPTDKALPENGTFAMKFMVKGSFMISEVVGGDATVLASSQKLQQYFQDFHKTSMAMNFTMLVTDRMLQPDSSKWVTKLYMPVY
ncbi:MAG: GyrI-like domain-containing protein [Bacteroidota bacterium]